ncbi:MAG: alpha/beta fold hydrolase [Opitutus sp.]
MRRANQSCPPLRSLRVVAGTLSAITLALLASGCSLFLRSTPTPIPTQTSRADQTTRAETLVVFLPGRGGRMGDFERNGFLSTMRAAGVRADAVIVDAHLGYYLKRTVIDRLAADVLEPARAQGYRRIVAVGISLGGLGALLTERERPHALDAIVLLAPYLGDDRKLLASIRAAGGPQAWAAHRDLRAGEVDEQIWTFLGTHLQQLPPTWLLSGRSDRLAEGQRMLAEILPPDRVRFVEGTHSWTAWRVLWREVCESSPVFAAERR